MTDPNVNPDPTTTSSFENAAIDPAAVRAAHEGGDGPPRSPRATDENPTIDQEIGMVAGALEREVAEQKEKYLRLYAEFDNFRRRSVKERQEAEHKGMQNLLRGILEMLDDLSRFAHVDPASTDSRTMVEGVAMVEKKMLKSLNGHGLEVIDPKGHPFNPALHEAITTTPAASKDEDHMVAQVYQVGYVHNGTLLRPARVVVTQWNG
jgi:molecular chaperone GrpE